MFIGPVKCPHCDAFVDMEQSFCPYCSQSLMGAPWKPGWNVVTISATVLIVVYFVAEKLCGGDLIGTIRTFFAEVP